MNRSSVDLVDSRQPYQVQRKNFSDLLNHVRYWKRAVGELGVLCSSSYLSFCTCGWRKKERVVAASSSSSLRNHARLYSIGYDPVAKENNLMFVDIVLSQSTDPSSTTAAAVATTEGEDGPRQRVCWQPLLKNKTFADSSFAKLKGKNSRKASRLSSDILSYDRSKVCDVFVFVKSGQLFRCFDDHQSDVDDHKSEAGGNGGGDCLVPEETIIVEPRICPSDSRFLAMIIGSDLYILFENLAERATFTGNGLHCT
ncbi:unnamed protein product [Soboliphyme baturini]|uniref:PPM-type phosphatase domain-containing protein n=1 Tax=Soboliphyme baturini TaxID=241478 RepID=A0A183IJ82_9BILA|nr:unnamed protein product [Soboliphyme baturini]